MDILKAGSQGGVQDFLPLTIDTRRAYQDDESDEDLPTAKRSCFREEDEDKEEDEECLTLLTIFRARKKYDLPEPKFPKVP